MRIEEDIKLDFSDVLMRPKRSELSSRKEVDLFREFKNPDGSTWKAVPIIAANMDTVGSFEMANALDKHGCMVALHKHYTVDEIVEYYQTNKPQNVFYSIGTSETDFRKLQEILTFYGDIITIDKLCIDVANGYSQAFLDKVKQLREMLPDAFILAGNVVTPEMTEELILSGVDCVKIGIGPGCFVADSMVTTSNGVKKIQDIKVGDMVLTHNNTFEKVISTMKKHADKTELIEINGITCTKNHEFYVIDEENKDKVNEKNYKNYAKWIPASLLTEKHYIIEL